MRIALIGMPAIGKTTVGRRLARLHECEFVDLDQLIEARIGCRISAYFEAMGEAAFRDVEARVLADVTETLPEFVLSTGGGVVLRAENRLQLRRSYLVLYLWGRPEGLLERVRNDTRRPLLEGGDPLARLRELYEQRHPLYTETADAQIHADGCNLRQIVGSIQQELQSRGLAATAAAGSS